MTDRREIDPMDLLARYAPTTATLDREWDAVRPADAVEIIVADEYDQPARLVPRRPIAHRRRVSTRVPVLVSIGVFGAAAAVLAAVLVSAVGGNGSGGYDAPAGGHRQPFDPPAGLSTTALGPKQYSYRVVEQVELDKQGKPVQVADYSMVDRNYVSAKGDIVSLRSGGQNKCFDLPNQGPDFSAPSVAFLAKLPTDVDALTRTLRSRVQGSSSRDEAVFVAVGDMLRTADGLASPKLRGALVAVLSRTPGVFLHLGTRDDAGRPALRLDFVNQHIRAGEIQSLYFDPSRFRLLEERSGRNGAATSYSGPSPAYSAPAPADGTDPQTLSGPASMTIMRVERVVAHLPKLPTNCRR